MKSVIENLEQDLHHMKDAVSSATEKKILASLKGDHIEAHKLQQDIDEFNGTIDRIQKDLRILNEKTYEIHE